MKIGEDLLPAFSVRQLQFYAGLCLRRFCEEKGISHPHLDEFQKHVFSIARAASLPDWAQGFNRLAVNGLGDPIPDDLAAAIPQDLQVPFLQLTCLCAEVGVGDLWGADSGNPLSFTRRILGLLEEQRIPAPDPEGLAFPQDGSHWGAVWSEEEQAAAGRFFRLQGSC